MSLVRVELHGMMAPWNLRQRNVDAPGDTYADKIRLGCDDR
jgi:hypothetical protein